MAEKVYLITGASSDVALSYIKRLDSQHRGETVTVVAHYNSSKDGLDSISKELKNINLVMVKADLSDKSQVYSLVEAVKAVADAPDVFLHFPATKFEYMRYKELDDEKIQKELDVQLFSFLIISKQFFPLMQKKEGTRAVVMLTSYVADEVPPKFMVHYVVAKYAMLGAMKAAASEFGGKKLKINGISPVMMDTKFLDNMDEHIKELNAMKSSIGRIPKAEELGPFIDKLLADDLPINGENLVVEEKDFE